MKISKFICFLIIFVSNAFCQEGWIKLNVFPPNYNLRRLFFLNPDSGFALGQKDTIGFISKTIDGGYSWSETEFKGQYPNDFCFPDHKYGLIVGYKGLILKSNNSGETWNPINFDYNYSLESIQHIAGDTVYMSGSYDFFKSFDMGHTWPSSYRTYGFDKIHFLSDSLGYGLVSWELHKTYNGGKSWTRVLYEATNNFTSLFFLNADTGYVVGSSSRYKMLFEYTHDGGNSFGGSSPADDGCIYDVYFLNYNLGYCVGSNGSIYKITNAYKNKIQQISNTSNKLTCISFPTKDIGYIGGQGGILLKTYNGGDISVLPNRNANENYMEKINLQIAPNPFNSKTNICFELTRSAMAELNIYNINGIRVKSFSSKKLFQGRQVYYWDGKTDRCSTISTGVYFLVLKIDNQRYTNKLIFLK